MIQLVEEADIFISEKKSYQVWKMVNIRGQFLGF